MGELPPSSPGLKTRILAFFIWLLARLLLATVRLKLVHRERRDRALAKGRPILYAFWHGRQLSLFKANPEKRLAVMTSLSRDGALQTCVCRHFGLEVVRGSSSRGGLSALLALRRCVKDGAAVGVAVDGPRGPAGQAKAGIIALARFSASPVVPITVGFRSFWSLGRAWDKFLIPKPFTRAVVAYGEPMWVDSQASASDLEGEAGRLSESLGSLTSEVDRIAAD